MQRCEMFSQRAGSPQCLPFFWDELNSKQHAMIPVGHTSSLRFIDCISHCLVSISPSALGCSPWFIPRPADTFACSLQQLSYIMVPPIAHVLLFACVTIHVLVRSSYGWHCIRADVQNSTQPRLITPLAICTSTPGLDSQSRTQVTFRSLSRWLC